MYLVLDNIWLEPSICKYTNSFKSRKQQFMRPPKLVTSHHSSILILLWEFECIYIGHFACQCETFSIQCILFVQFVLLICYFVLKVVTAVRWRTSCQCQLNDNKYPVMFQIFEINVAYFKDSWGRSQRYFCFGKFILKRPQAVLS